MLQVVIALAQLHNLRSVKVLLQCGEGVVVCLGVNCHLGDAPRYYQLNSFLSRVYLKKLAVSHQHKLIAYWNHLCVDD